MNKFCLVTPEGIVSSQTENKLKANIAKSVANAKTAVLTTAQKSADKVFLDIYVGEDVKLEKDLLAQLDKWFTNYVALLFKANGTEESHSAPTVDAQKRIIHIEETRSLSQAGKQAFKKTILDAIKTVADKTSNSGKAKKPNEGKTGKPDEGKAKKPDEGKASKPDEDKAKKPDEGKAKKPDESKTGDLDYSRIPNDALTGWFDNTNADPKKALEGLNALAAKYAK